MIIVVASFLAGKFNHSPDIYLDELRDALEDESGVRVDLSAVWQALQIKGLYNQKGRYCIVIETLADCMRLARSPKQQWGTTKINRMPTHTISGFTTQQSGSSL